MVWPDRVTRAALAFFTLTTLLFWLPAVRGAFDGASYQWALLAFGGRGIAGDYWFPLLGACGALAVRSGVCRGRRWAVLLLTGWSVLVLSVAVWMTLSSPDDFRFRGDTLGMDVSLAWAGPLLLLVGLALSLIAAWRVWRHRPQVSTWGVSNRRWLILLAGLLPLQLVLLRLGGAGSTLDRVGVLLTIAQWLLAGRIFRPRREDSVGAAAVA